VGAFVALGALGAFVDEGDLVDLGALVEDGDLVDLGALVDEGALVAAGSLVAFNCLLLTTGCSSATTAAMSAQRRVIIVADFILFFSNVFVLIDLCFYEGTKYFRMIVEEVKWNKIVFVATAKCALNRCVCELLSVESTIMT
jgi:hypothetical protein